MNILPVRASERKQSTGCAKLPSFLAFVTEKQCLADSPCRSFFQARVVRPRLVRCGALCAAPRTSLVLFAFVDNLATDHRHRACRGKNFGLGNLHDVARENSEISQLSRFDRSFVA